MFRVSAKSKSVILRSFYGTCTAMNSDTDSRLPEDFFGTSGVSAVTPTVPCIYNLTTLLKQFPVHKPENKLF